MAKSGCVREADDLDHRATESTEQIQLNSCIEFAFFPLCSLWLCGESIDGEPHRAHRGATRFSAHGGLGRGPGLLSRKKKLLTDSAERKTRPGSSPSAATAAGRAAR